MQPILKRWQLPIPHLEGSTLVGHMTYTSSLAPSSPSLPPPFLPLPLPPLPVNLAMIRFVLAACPSTITFCVERFRGHVTLVYAHTALAHALLVTSCVPHSCPPPI